MMLVMYKCTTHRCSMIVTLTSYIILHINFHKIYLFIQIFSLPLTFVTGKLLEKSRYFDYFIF